MGLEDQYRPLVAWIVLQSAVGLIGNSLTIRFYSKPKSKRSTTVFIASIAVFDFAVCLLSLTSILAFDGGVKMVKISCKVTIFTYRVFVLTSVVLIWMLTLDRFTKICGFRSWHFTTKTAGMLVYASFLLACLFSLPYFVIYDVDNRNVTATHTLSHCAMSTEENLKSIILTSNITDVLSFILVFITLMRMYMKIFNRLRNHRKSTKSKSVVNGESDFQAPDITNDSIDLTDCHLNASFDITNNVVSKRKKNTQWLGLGETRFYIRSSPQIARRYLFSENENTISRRAGNRPSMRNKMRNSKVVKRYDIKIVTMLVMMAVALVVCFCPYFAVTLWFRVIPHKPVVVRLPWVQAALRMPFMNSALNPILFLSFDSKYRAYVKGLWNK